jgi:hypothetical protein
MLCVLTVVMREPIAINTPVYTYMLPTHEIQTIFALRKVACGKCRAFIMRVSYVCRHAMCIYSSDARTDRDQHSCSYTHTALAQRSIHPKLKSSEM